MPPQRRTLAAAAALALGLSGCGTVGLFGKYDLPESEGVEETPWPRLVDVPEAPPPGGYAEGVPDPAEGVAVQADLGPVARSSAARAEALEGAVLTEADRRALARARR